jgi:K+-transporting ATPase ATPase C chain
MRRQWLPTIRMLLVLAIGLGLVYPLVILGIGQLAFNDQANGSLVKVDGKVVGSSLIGQNFTATKYFEPRPSAAGTGYDGYSSGASNLGPTNPDLIKAVTDRAVAYRKLNGLAANATVPVDAVTGSASGLDPDISLANARLQAPRVARVRHLPLATVRAMIDSHTDGPTLGFLGEKVVNVLQLNLALDSRT